VVLVTPSMAWGAVQGRAMQGGGSRWVPRGVGGGSHDIEHWAPPSPPRAGGEPGAAGEAGQAAGCRGAPAAHPRPGCLASSPAPDAHVTRRRSFMLI